jgi:ABC-type uncharacterized transport system substrate-binding protein
VTRKNEEIPVVLSDEELEMLKDYAAMHGLELNEAASKLANEGMAKRIKKNLGKTPAKVYGIKNRH